VLVDEQRAASSATSFKRIRELVGRRVREPPVRELRPGTFACLPFSRSKRNVDLARDLDAREADLPSPIDACMSPTANMPPG